MATDYDPSVCQFGTTIMADVVDVEEVVPLAEQEQ